MEAAESLIEGLDVDLDEAKEKIREHSLNHPAEVYQWFRVSSWLCEKLKEIVRSYSTTTTAAGGRQCCGTCNHHGRTLQKIANKFV